jgi:hypothetical protein
VHHSAPTTATGTHPGVRAASSGTPSAPTTAAIWNSEATDPDPDALSPRSPASSVGSQVVTA